MNYSIFITPQFKKDIKYYKNKKKYYKITNDLDEIIEELKIGNLLGNKIPNLNLKEEESVYKVRTINSSIKVGKSNGFRLIYYVIKNNKEIYLLTVFSKKDHNNIPNSQIVKLIKRYC